MDRDELVERVAALLCHYRGPSRFNSCCPGPVYNCQTKARAALAIIEPAVREMCAKVAERASTCSVLTVDGWERKPDAVAQRCAAAIRAGAKP